jgi:hypothetical protein
MNAARARLARVEALVIALVLFASAMVLIFRVQTNELPALGGPPTPTTTSSFAPSRPPGVAPTPGPSSEQPGPAVPVRFQPHGGSSKNGGPAPQPSQAPQPSPSPTSSVSGVWTNCHTANGMLACAGVRGSFTCTTARTGDTACKGAGVSFSCSTDTSTGARACASGSDSWRCVTNADTKSTGCAGTSGSFTCSPNAQSGAAESCTGLHSFSCYDDETGRNCGTTTRYDPDCYFEPVFGAYCRT